MLAKSKLNIYLKYINVTRRCRLKPSDLKNIIQILDDQSPGAVNFDPASNSMNIDVDLISPFLFHKLAKMLEEILGPSHYCCPQQRKK